MRHSSEGSLQFSPSDLITFLEGEFATWMERAYAERRRQDSELRPDDSDPEMELVRGKGMEHEASVLGKLESLHGQAVRIEGEGATTDTLAAMQSGKKLIYQGRLNDGAWHGYPDFLLRTVRSQPLPPQPVRILDRDQSRLTTGGKRQPDGRKE